MPRCPHIEPCHPTRSLHSNFVCTLADDAWPLSWQLGKAGVKGMGQPVHVDVQQPELICFAYLLPGVPTNVYEFGQVSEDNINNKLANEVSGYTLETMLRSTPSPLHLNYHSAGPLMEEGLLNYIKPACGMEKVQGGDVLRLMGSWPHAAGALTKDLDKRMVLFSVATPVRCMNPYKGYVQIMIGKPS